MGAFRDGEGRTRSGWVVAAFAALAVGTEGVLYGVAWFFNLLPGRTLVLDDPRIAASSCIHLLSALVATAGCRWLFKQDAGLKHVAWVLPGLVAGAVLLTVTVAIAGLASGTLGVSTCDSKLWHAILVLALIGPTSIGEELLLRGVPLRALARGTGPRFAVCGTGLVFGLLHLANPGATPVAALNVGLVGVWFGAMAWRFQSLWPSIGAHVAWNWFEGYFWGQNVSGIRATCSVLTATAHGRFFSGGEFGPEASGLASVLLLTACLVTARLHRPAGYVRDALEGAPSSEE